MSAFLALMRAQREQNAKLIFGDGGSRGNPAEEHLRENLQTSYSKPVTPRFTEVGFEGIFAARAVDQARLIEENASPGIAGLARAWTGVEHARTLADVLGALSPIPRPPPASVESTDPPQPAGVFAVAGVRSGIGAGVEGAGAA